MASSGTELRWQKVESGMRWLLKRWWLSAGTGFMLVALVVGYLVIPLGPGRISQANCGRIQLGWDVGRVNSLLEREAGLVFVCEGNVNWFFWCDDDGNMISAWITPQGLSLIHI